MRDIHIFLRPGEEWEWISILQGPSPFPWPWIYRSLTHKTTVDWPKSVKLLYPLNDLCDLNSSAFYKVLGQNPPWQNPQSFMSPKNCHSQCLELINFGGFSPRRFCHRGFRHRVIFPWGILSWGIMSCGILSKGTFVTRDFAMRILVTDSFY